jgi:hypothetical protein
VEEKEKFKLEKMLEIIKNISIQETEYLKHLYYDVKPLQDEYLRRENDLNSFDYDYLIKAKPLTSFISELKKLY